MSELPASFGTSYFDYMHAEQLQYNRNQASGQEKKVFIFEIIVLYVNTYISNPGAFHFE